MCFPRLSAEAKIGDFRTYQHGQRNRSGPCQIVCPGSPGGPRLARRVQSEARTGTIGNSPGDPFSCSQAPVRPVSATLHIYSRDFDADFFKLPGAIQARIQSAIDHLGLRLDTYSHRRMKGVDAFRPRVGDYRIIYSFER